MNSVIVGIVIGILLTTIIVITMPLMDCLDGLGACIGILAVGLVCYAGFDIYDIKNKTYRGGAAIHRKYTTDFLKRPIGNHKEVLVDYDKDVLQMIRNQEVPNLSHLEYSANKSSTLNRILDLTDGLPYKKQGDVFRRLLHWGQLKLFLSEVEFLTKVMTDAGSKEIVFVYAGAAPGHHIEYLHRLFPKIRFELYDPNDFVVKDSDLIKTHVQFFMDVDAKYWRDYIKEHPDTYLAFCSDIRSQPATDENIRRNMAMQLEWWKIMNPDLSMFKFRLPWESGKTEYPEGKIYIQVFPSAVSTETRLIVKKDAKIIEYDNNQYESACFKHNMVYRRMHYPTKLGNELSLEKDGLDNCYDCASFIHIMDEYIRTTGIKTPLNKLVIDVQRNITQGQHDVKTHTIMDYQNFLQDHQQRLYQPCGNKECRLCLSGKKDRVVIKSKATLDYEKEYVSKLDIK